jgi:NTE family protein
MNGLVLAGGGARAAYQVGVLSYIAEKAPEVQFPIITGVSAGAINAAFIAGHRGTPRESLRALVDCWTRLKVDRVFTADFAKLGMQSVRLLWSFGGRTSRLQGLLDTTPLRDFLDREVDWEGIDSNVSNGRLRALGLSTTRWATGQTVTFVHGASGTPTWERARRCGVPTKIAVGHVMASGSLPLIFSAVPIDGEYYGDGSIRQSAPLAPAIHLGADRLLAIGTRYGATLDEVKERATQGYPSPAHLLGMLFNTIFLDALDADAERLDRLNRVLETLPADSPSPESLKRIRLLVLRPSRDLGKLAGEFAGKLPRSLTFMLKGLGVSKERGADLLSYLIFEEGYLSRVIDLGYEDALSQWPEIERFFADD